MNHETRSKIESVYQDVALPFKVGETRSTFSAPSRAWATSANVPRALPRLRSAPVATDGHERALHGDRPGGS